MLTVNISSGSAEPVRFAPEPRLTFRGFERAIIGRDLGHHLTRMRLDTRRPAGRSRPGTLLLHKIAVNMAPSKARTPVKYAAHAPRAV